MKKQSISNILIFLSLITTVIRYFNYGIDIFGMSREFILNKEYGLFAFQLLFYQFIHGGFGHLFSNSIFLFIFGNQLEHILGKNKYIIFFVLNSIFVAICILLFSNWNTIGISGFTLAILAYLVMDVKKINKKEFIGGIVLIVLNILAGLDGNISFVGHLSGAIFGIIFYYFTNILVIKNLKKFF